jgi:hypothetical protein
MPVTAKLSSRFYEKLGEVVTNELVTWLNAVDAEFRPELREANDRNWDRLRAELDALSGRLTGEFRGGLAELRTELRTGLAGAQAGFGTSLTDFRTEINAASASFQTGIRKEISDLRVEMHQEFTRQLRWMFGFWATTTFTIVGLKFL